MESNENESVAKEGDEISSTELDEEACIRVKKKSRRVSFADITSVHVFDRDEDFETPPDNKPNVEDKGVRTPPSVSPEPRSEGLADKHSGHHFQLIPTSNLQEKSEHSDLETGTPGSESETGTPGEDGEFFGPVSYWHIAPGISARSPSADDITLDCTTFSLQFGKLMFLDKQCGNTTEGIKTPATETEGKMLPTEEFKTPAEQPRRGSTGNSMVLTEVKKPLTWQIVSDAETLGNREGINDMSLIEENQFDFDFASMPPDLDSLLAEKLSQIQPDIPFKKLNQVSPQPEVANASRKTSEGMESKDSTGIETQIYTTEAISTMKQEDVKVTPRQERNQSAIEIISPEHDENKLAIVPASCILDSDRKDQQCKQPSPRLSPQKKLESINIFDGSDRYCIDMITTEHGNETKQKRNAELMEIGNFSLTKFEQQQQQQQLRLSDIEVHIEPENYIGLDMVRSTIETMSSKHGSDSTGTATIDKAEYNRGRNLTTTNCISHLNFKGDQSQVKGKQMIPLNTRQEMGLEDPSDVEVEPSNIEIAATKNNSSGFTADVETSQCMVKIMEINCNNGYNTLGPSDDSHYLKFEEQQKHQQKSLLKLGCYVEQNDAISDFERSANGIVATKHSCMSGATQAVQMNLSTSETVVNKCEEGIKLKVADDSFLSNFDEKQENQKQQRNESEATQDVEMDISTNESLTNKCSEDSKLQPANDSSLFKFEGKQEELQRQERDEFEPTEVVAMSLSTNKIEPNMCSEDSGLKPAYDSSLCNFDGKQQGHQKQQKTLMLNPRREMAQNDSTVGEISIIDSTATEHNNLTTDTEKHQLIPEIAKTLHAMPFHSNFESEQNEEQQQMLLNPKIDLELKTVDGVHTERLTNYNVKSKEKNDMKLTPVVQKNNSATRTVVTKCTKEHLQQQQQLSISSQGLNSNKGSKLLENCLIENFNEAKSMSKTVETKILSPRKEQQQEPFLFVEDAAVVSLSKSSENEHSFRSVTVVPESNERAERDGTVPGKHIFQRFPALATCTEEVHKFVDSRRFEVSSDQPQSNMKQSIPMSGLSKYSAISCSAMPSSEEPKKLEKANVYTLTPDVNMEDCKSKSMKLTSLFSASGTQMPFSSSESKEGHAILANAVTTPMESSANRFEINFMPSSQNTESTFLVQGSDKGESSSLENELSKDQNGTHGNCYSNNITNSASYHSFPSQLISSVKKSANECELYDLRQNLSPAHNNALMFGNTDHVLVSNSDRNLLTSQRPSLASIQDVVFGMTPLVPLDKSVSSANTRKSNYFFLNRNEAKGCDTANIVFSTPVNLISHGDATSSHLHFKNREHYNLCRERRQLDVLNSFPHNIRDTHKATSVSTEHKQTTTFVDSYAQIKSSLNDDLCCSSHSRGSSQKERNQEESTLKQPHACFTPGNDDNSARTDPCYISINVKDSICKQSGPGKLNKEFSSTRAMDNEETCRMAYQNIKADSNHGNSSLPLLEMEWSSSHRRKVDWKNSEEDETPKCASGFLSQGSMIQQHGRFDRSLKKIEFPYVSENLVPTKANDGKGYHGMKRKIQEIDIHCQGIKDHANRNLSCEIKPAETGLNGKVNLQYSDGRTHSNKKSLTIRTQTTEDTMAPASRELIKTSNKFSQGGEKLHIPLIAKPKTLEECLSFIFLSQPQLCLLQDTLKKIQKEIDKMNIFSRQQLQASDAKNWSEMENKMFLKKNQSLGSVKWLQLMIVYEKSKILLLQAKKHELMKKAQELHSGCQEVDKLKSKFGGHLTKALERAEKKAYVHYLQEEIGKQVERVSNRTVLMEGKVHKRKEEDQEAYEKVIIMKQELEVLDNRIRDLCEYFGGALKIKSNTNKDEIIMLLKNHVEKRSLATNLLNDMQLWKVKDIRSMPGDHFIELSYNDILSQRLIFKGDASNESVSTYSRLNNEKVQKVFPFMNSNEVFGFVLGSKQSHKIVGFGSIWQIVRETSFILGTSMHVLEEVQTCRMRLQNLSFTQFVCPTGHELHLQLTFIDCTVGLKARVDLDMSNLRSGVYPCDVLPLSIKIEQCRKQPKTLLMAEEILEIVGTLKPGYSRIKDLCGCISKVIESKR